MSVTDSGTPPAPPPGSGAPPVPGGGELPVSTPGRYELLQLLGVGGMGEVWLAEDTLLERQVALKLIRADLWRRVMDEGRFLAEARLQARLQHPDIVPLYDVGRLFGDERPFFTMRVVRGRSLRDLWSDAPADGPELRRRVEVMRRVAEAVDFAHREGLLHRDLKPHNVMLGDSGEVTVVDWGIGLALQAEGATQIAGTPPYMAPEAYSGAPIDERADVYGLGATLLQLVAGGMLSKERPLREQIPAGTPDELAELLRASVEPERRRRLASALAFAQGLQSWLDGARERERALGLVAEATSRRVLLEARKEEVARLEAEKGRLSAGLKPWDPVALKRPLWAVEARIEALRDEVALDEVSVQETLGAALQRSPGLREAREALADLHQIRHAEAEARGDVRAAAQHEVLLRAADTGRHAAWLSGEGRLTLLSDPPGATVRLHRYVEQDRRLIPVFERELGPTPLVELPLERGSWLCTLHAPGRAAVRYPVAIGRCEHWDGVPPAGREPRPVYLPREEELGPEDVYVPAGWSWVGGDARAPRSLPRQRVWVEGFVMRRFPVTNREYLAFLNDLVAQGRGDEAEGWVPGRAPSIFAYAAEKGWSIVGDADGFVTPLDWPVVLIDWEMACAFAAWSGERERAPWRLPWELEWERAARGVDARVYPWGNVFDPTFSRISESVPAPLPTHVRDYQTDESVWGVRGLAGNALSWCADVFQLGGPEGLNGGSWASPHLSADRMANRTIRGAGYTGTSLLARSATRHPYTPGHRSEVVSLRLARGLSGGH